MTDGQDEDQNNLLDTNLDDEDLDNEINNKVTLSPNDLFLKELEELLKPLISSIERMKTEATHAANSFDATTQDAVSSFHNIKQSMNEVIKRINNPLSDLSKTNDNLQATAKLLAILPNKIDDRLAKLPHNFSQVLSDYIPDIAEKLNSTLEQTVRRLIQRLDESCKSTSMDTEKSTTELVTIFKTEIDKLSGQFMKDTLLYKTELEQIIEVGSKNRMRKFLLILVTAGSFSAIISGVTSWVINKYFPRSVEITGNGHLVVKDSQVLVHGSDTYKLEKQKKEGK